MRYLAVLFATLVLAGCKKAPVTRGGSQAVSPTVVEFLLTSAVTDLHTHRPPDPIRFRDVPKRSNCSRAPQCQAFELPLPVARMQPHSPAELSPSF